jgi:hypothetical protein
MDLQADLQEAHQEDHQEDLQAAHLQEESQAALETYLVAEIL